MCTNPDALSAQGVPKSEGERAKLVLFSLISVLSPNWSLGCVVDRGWAKGAHGPTQQQDFPGLVILGKEKARHDVWRCSWGTSGLVPSLSAGDKERPMFCCVAISLFPSPPSTERWGGTGSSTAQNNPLWS